MSVRTQFGFANILSPSGAHRPAPRAGTTPTLCVQRRSPHVPAAPLLWPPTTPGAGAGQSAGGCPGKAHGLLRQRSREGGQVPAGFQRCGQALRQWVRFAFTQRRVSWGAAQPQRLRTQRDGEQATSEAMGKLQARALSCGLRAGLFSTCPRQGQVQAPALLCFALCQQRPACCQPSAAETTRSYCLLATSTGAPGRDTRGTGPTLKECEAGAKTQPAGFKSSKVSPQLSSFHRPQAPLLPAMRLLQRQSQGAELSWLLPPGSG